MRDGSSFTVVNRRTGSRSTTLPSLYALKRAGRAAWPVASGWKLCKIGSMERDHVLAALKAHEHELRTAGVLSVSLFGSVARGEDSAHDVDVAVQLSENFSAPGL